MEHFQFRDPERKSAKKSDFNAQRGFKRVPVELRHNGPMAGNLGKTEVDTDTQKEKQTG